MNTSKDELLDEAEAAHAINARLQAEITNLRTALEWYAKGGTNWDKGKRARAALA